MSSGSECNTGIDADCWRVVRKDINEAGITNVPLVRYRKHPYDEHMDLLIAAVIASAQPGMSELLDCQQGQEVLGRLELQMELPRDVKEEIRKELLGVMPISCPVPILS